MITDNEIASINKHVWLLHWDPSSIHTCLIENNVTFTLEFSFLPRWYLPLNWRNLKAFFSWQMQPSSRGVWWSALRSERTGCELSYVLSCEISNAVASPHHIKTREIYYDLRESSLPHQPIFSLSLGSTYGQVFTARGCEHGASEAACLDWTEQCLQYFVFKMLLTESGRHGVYFEQAVWSYVHLI